MVQKSFLAAIGMVLLPLATQAQDTAGDASGLQWNIWLIISIVLLLIVIVAVIGDRLLKLTAQQAGAKDTDSYSVLPSSFAEFFGRAKKRPADVPEEAAITNLRKGFNLKLAGEAEERDLDTETRATTYAIKPKDFVGMSPIPKVLVQEGESVKAGDILFFDKKRPEIKYAAPVSGELIAVNRAEKRSIAELVILADKEQQYRSYELPNLDTVEREELVNFLLESGVWPFIRQRPFDIVAQPEVDPKAIFISTFDTAPLATNLNLSVKGNEAAFQTGLDVLAKLTSGKVHLGLDARGEYELSTAFTEANGVEKHWFAGRHPAGNVGIHIHHTAPLNPEEVIWYLNVENVMALGRLFREGRFNTERLVAVTGSSVERPRYVKTYQGAKISDITGELQDEKVRLISGDVLTGEATGKEGFLGFFENQVTAIPEGDYYEPFGWLIPQKTRPSLSNTYPTSFAPNTVYEVDTNTHGEKRAFVVTGEYQEVLPMDILMQPLLKSILVGDLERMEGLGLLELSEEDVALCEFVCTSKQPVQQIVRDGLDMIRAQSM